MSRRCAVQIRKLVAIRPALPLIVTLLAFELQDRNTRVSGALVLVQSQEAMLAQAASALKAQSSDLEQRIEQVLENARAPEKELARFIAPPPL